MDELLHYVQMCLQIIGAAMALAFNCVRLTLHDRLEGQRRRSGRGRALVLKFRQPGFSTLSRRQAGLVASFMRAGNGQRAGVEDYAAIFLRGSGSLGLAGA